MRLLFTTVPGLEAAAAAELDEEHGLAAVAVGAGDLVADVDEGELGGRLRTLNARLRCVERVGVLLAVGPARPLGTPGRLAREVDWERWIDPGQRFAIRASRHGDQRYGSPDVGRVVGQAVIDAYRDARGVRLPVDLDDPDVILRADVRDEDFRLWLDTTGDDDLSTRAYRQYVHMASMRPVVANLLLRLSGWRGEELVDPLCGSGTILVEAALRARGVMPGRMRGAGWAWERLTPRLVRSGGGVGSPTPLVPAEEPLRIRGVERFERHLQGAWRNQAAAGLAGELQVLEGRAERLDELLPTSRGRRIVVTNPPFGRRVASTAVADDLYEAVAAACRRAGVVRIVTLSERGEAMAAALEAAGYRVRERIPVTYGSLAVEVFVADL